MNKNIKVFWAMVNRRNFVQTRKIFKSLSVILFLVGFGWSTNTMLELIIPWLVLSPDQYMFGLQMCSFFANTISGSNLFVLYTFRFCPLDKWKFISKIYSGEYHRAINGFLKRLLASQYNLEPTQNRLFGIREQRNNSNDKVII